MIVRELVAVRAPAVRWPASENPGQTSTVGGRSNLPGLWATSVGRLGLPTESAFWRPTRRIRAERQHPRMHGATAPVRGEESMVRENAQSPLVRTLGERILDGDMRARSCDNDPRRKTAGRSAAGHGVLRFHGHSGSIVASSQLTEAGRVFTERRTEALLDLHVLCRPPVALPFTGDWAASPDFLVEVILRAQQYAEPPILECGSGVSTLWLGLWLSRRGQGRLVSLEHDASYAGHIRGSRAPQPA